MSINQQQIQHVTIQQIPQLVAVQVIPETQKSQELKMNNTWSEWDQYFKFKTRT